MGTVFCPGVDLPDLFPLVHLVQPGTERLRILMLSDVYFPRINGVSTSIETFRCALQDQGMQVDLVAPEYPYHDSRTETGIERVPSHYLFFDAEDRMMSLRGLRRRTALLTQRHYDLVHVQTPFLAHRYGLRLARQWQVPVLETYHTHFEEYLAYYLPWVPTRWIRAGVRRLSRRQCAAVDAVVVPTRQIQELLQGYGVTTPMTILPTGLLLERFRPGDGQRFRAQWSIPQDRPLLVYVGRVAHEKNIGFLLQMLHVLRQTCPEAILLVAGEGPAQTFLERQAQQLGVRANLRFVGYLDRQTALLDCYSAGDLFVFASRTETQGLVLLEALALGLPVVALAELGTRDILLPERGARVAPDDPAGFAAIVQQLLNDAEQRTRMSAAGKAYVQEWSAPALAARLAALYRSLGKGT
jgi:1,2-diacylglycerol 3-alpha-glucosyltransferase